VASGKVDVKPLITNRFKFEEAEKAFELVKAAQEGVFKGNDSGCAVNIGLYVFNIRLIYPISSPYPKEAL
jgi:hypothetical protein